LSQPKTLCYRNRMLKKTRPNFVFIMVVLLGLAGCSYRFGYDQRDMPGGLKIVSVQPFGNKTSFVGAESSFTDALIEEFHRSRVAQVVPSSLAQAKIEGTVTSIVFTPGPQVEGETSGSILPKHAVLTTAYIVAVEVDVRVVEVANNKVLWNAPFVSRRRLKAPSVELAGLNSVNALYLHSAKSKLISDLAKEMMRDAHDRMTENF
jgi:hypothetical protein